MLGSSTEAFIQPTAPMDTMSIIVSMKDTSTNCSLNSWFSWQQVWCFSSHHKSQRQETSECRYSSPRCYQTRSLFGFNPFSFAACQCCSYQEIQSQELQTWTTRKMPCLQQACHHSLQGLSERRSIWNPSVLDLWQAWQILHGQAHHGALPRHGD